MTSDLALRRRRVDRAVRLRVAPCEDQSSGRAPPRQAGRGRLCGRGAGPVYLQTQPTHGRRRPHVVPVQSPADRHRQVTTQGGRPAVVTGHQYGTGPAYIDSSSRATWKVTSEYLSVMVIIYAWSQLIPIQESHGAFFGFIHPVFVQPSQAPKPKMLQVKTQKNLGGQP